MSRFFVSSHARDDLDEIWEFIAHNNLDAADRLLDTFEQAFHKLAEMPGMGHVREDLAPTHLRFWPVGRYFIIYRSSDDTIEIVCVLSGFRDIVHLPL